MLYSEWSENPLSYEMPLSEHLQHFHCGCSWSTNTKALSKPERNLIFFIHMNKHAYMDLTIIKMSLHFSVDFKYTSR